MAGCLPYLKRQIAIIQPKLIVCLGATAVRGLVAETLPIGKARGQWRTFEGIPVMLTFHPAYLLRDGSKKKYAWQDLKAVLARLGNLCRWANEPPRLSACPSAGRNRRLGPDASGERPAPLTPGTTRPCPQSCLCSRQCGT